MNKEITTTKALRTGTHEENKMAAQAIRYCPETIENESYCIICPPALVRGTESELLRLVLPLIEQGTVTIDLGELSALDAAGLGTLAVLRDLAKKSGNKLNFANPQPRIRQLLILTRLLTASPGC